MTTIVNSPAPAEGSGGSGFLIGALVLVALVAILLYFGIPAIGRMGTTQINVPDKIDVNVTQTK